MVEYIPAGAAVILKMLQLVQRAGFYGNAGAGSSFCQFADKPLKARIVRGIPPHKEQLFHPLPVQFFHKGTAHHPGGTRYDSSFHTSSAFLFLQPFRLPDSKCRAFPIV